MIEIGDNVTLVIGAFVRDICAETGECEIELSNTDGDIVIVKVENLEKIETGF